ncbi:MAG: hypothetical protein ACRCXT_00475 [Paraclostridium sp.]
MSDREEKEKLACDCLDKIRKYSESEKNIDSQSPFFYYRLLDENVINWEEFNSMASEHTKINLLSMRGKDNDRHRWQ